MPLSWGNAPSAVLNPTGGPSATLTCDHVLPSSWLIATYGGPHHSRGTYTLPAPSTMPCPAPPSQLGAAGSSVVLTPNAGSPERLNVSPPSSDFEQPVSVELPERAPPLIAQ